MGLPYMGGGDGGRNGLECLTVHLMSHQSVPPLQRVPIAWGSALLSEAGAWSVGRPTDLCVVPGTMLVQLRFSVQFASSLVGIRRAGVWVNGEERPGCGQMTVPAQLGGTPTAPTTPAEVVGATAVLTVSAGDVLTVWAQHTAPTTLLVVNSALTWVCFDKIG